MRCLFFILVFPFYTNAQSPSSIIGTAGQQNLSRNAVYLFCRGTKTKAGLVSRQFNLSDSNITHTGIGFFKGDSLVVYHVTDSGGGGQALLVEPVSSFLSGYDVFYFSAWACRVSRKDLRILKRVLYEYTQRTIVFDLSFLISRDDTLYCSEFCVNILSKLENADFDFVPAIKSLSGLYAAILKRKELVYYPVDFFLTGKRFRKIFEQWFNR